MFANDGHGMIWRRFPSTGLSGEVGMQLGSGLGGGTCCSSFSCAAVHVGWSLSKSVPFLMICLNCDSVLPPSGLPNLSGVKLRAMMCGPAYPDGPVGVPA